MALLAAHLNDAGIAVSDGERLLYREPGFALLGAERIETGATAWASAALQPRLIQNRYWSELSAEPLPERRFAHLSNADLVSRQLEQVWAQVARPGDELVVAVPAGWSNPQLGLLLGIAEGLSIPIVAMADAAVAATRRQYEHAVPVHLDIGLHAALITRLIQDDEVAVERNATVDNGGLLALNTTWLKLIAAAFVKQSRFDPLHTAETEQALRDRLPGWLSEAASARRVTMSIDSLGMTHRAEIESLALVAAAAPAYQAIVSRLRALCRAEEMPALQLTDRAASLPGLADTLRARVGGQVFVLEPGASARGLAARCKPQRGAAGVTLQRRLPWDRAAVTVERPADGGAAGRPTHLLFGNDAWHLNGTPLLLGSRPDADGRWLDLQGEMPGVSRRHCVLGVEDGQVVVTDESRYGTFLNGHRIDGSAVLQIGDLLRIGTPGFEFRLITTEVDDAA